MTAAKPKVGSNPTAHPRVRPNNRMILYDGSWVWYLDEGCGYFVSNHEIPHDVISVIARDQYAEWLDIANRASDLIMRRTRQFKKKPLVDWLYDALVAIEIDAIGIAEQWRAWERDNEIPVDRR